MLNAPKCTKPTAYRAPSWFCRNWKPNLKGKLGEVSEKANCRVGFLVFLVFLVSSWRSALCWPAVGVLCVWNSLQFSTTKILEEEQKQAWCKFCLDWLCSGELLIHHDPSGVPKLDVDWGDTCYVDLNKFNGFLIPTCSSKRFEFVYSWRCFGGAEETGQALPSGPDEILPPTAKRDKGKGKSRDKGKGQSGKDKGKGSGKSKSKSKDPEWLNKGPSLSMFVMDFQFWSRRETKESKEIKEIVLEAELIAAMTRTSQIHLIFRQ